MNAFQVLEYLLNQGADVNYNTFYGGTCFKYYTESDY
jgi:hypothetical protein